MAHTVEGPKRINNFMLCVGCGLYYEFIRVAQVKKPLLLLQKYTFARTTSDNRYWNCSKKFGHEKCPARLRFDSHGNLVFVQLDHNHQPPTFYKQRDVGIPMSSAEKQRRYKERLMRDPVKYEEYKRKKRENYHKTKILVKDMTPHQRQNARLMWKNRKKREAMQAKYYPYEYD